MDRLYHEGDAKGKCSSYRAQPHESANGQYFLARENNGGQHHNLVFELSGLQTLLLDESHLDLLQDLYERCHDFIQLTTGQPPQPNAAHDLFQELPPGKSWQDKFVLGFVRNKTTLVRVLDTIQGYPDLFTWYIGLLMFTPQERGQGVGRQVLETLERWVLQHRGRSLRLIVQAQNVRGLAFWRRGGFELEGTAIQATETGTNTVYKMVRHLTVLEDRTI